MNSIKEQYKLAKDIFSEIEERVLADIEKSKFIETNKALFYNTKKIDLLLETLTKSSFYSSQALTRIIHEHFLVGSYIWTRSRIDDNDNCGNEYKISYFLSEFFKRENYKTSIDNIQNNIKDKVDLNTIKANNEGLDMSESNLSEIHRVANQFNIRKIGDYLVNKIPNDDPYVSLNVMMLDFIREYNFLSSYIHGGPYSERETFFHDFNVNQSQKLIVNLHWGQIASKQTKINLMYSLMREFPDSYRDSLVRIISL